MKVKLKFLNTLPDLARKFRFASDTLDKIDSNRHNSIKCPNCGSGYEDQTYIGDDSFVCSSCNDCYYDNPNYNLGENDKRIIEQNLIDTENPHNQLLKTVQIEFEIYGITRSLMQEFSKHQIGVANITKSTRYTLGRIAKDERIVDENKTIEDIRSIVETYYYIPEIESWSIENWIIDRYKELLEIKIKKLDGCKNDNLKHLINEFMLCNTAGTISGLSLKNMLKQRLDNTAWYQFQYLAKELYKEIPKEWKPLFEVYKYKKFQLSIKAKDVLEKFIKNDISISPLAVKEIRELLNKNLVEKIKLN